MADALVAGVEAIRARDALTPAAHDRGITVAWTTWAEIADTVRSAVGAYGNVDDVDRSVRRQAGALLDAVAFHG